MLRFVISFVFFCAALSSLVSAQEVISLPYNPDFLVSWPNDWTATNPEVYNADFVIGGLSGEGTWLLVIVNGWSGSQGVNYNLNIELSGLCID